jgi:maltose alpha-D-glucosyltransferase/alpha-amylase
MPEWFQNQVMYSLYVQRFADANDDGVGDIEGLTERLNYLAGLGVECIWLLPILASPGRDGGYDVADFYRLDSRIGDQDDLDILLEEASEHGLRVLMDLPLNHTSRDHPWFQEARRDPDSPYRDYYIWADQRPDDHDEGLIFAGPQQSNWSWDEEAGQFYYHTFYDHEPDLNFANPRVREEIKDVMRYWIRRGFAGFRLDALAHTIRAKGDIEFETDPHHYLREFRAVVESERDDAILMGELDLDPHEYERFLGTGRQLHVLLNFYLCAYLFLALARQRAEPLVDALERLPAMDGRGRWGNFLRNHDELDLQRLEPDEMHEVMAEFGDDERMQAFGRGIRRRLAPMLGDDRRRLELAHSLLLTLPGTPVLYYGQEIAMGEQLDLPGRSAMRTVMQWANLPNGGFSQASADELISPVLSDERWGFPGRNVVDQRRDPGSFYNWLSAAIRVRNDCKEFGEGKFVALEASDPRVMAHRLAANHNSVVMHNLSDQEVTVEVGIEESLTEELLLVFDSRRGARQRANVRRLTLEPYGYRWFRETPLARQESP